MFKWVVFVFANNDMLVMFISWYFLSWRVVLVKNMIGHLIMINPFSFLNLIKLVLAIFYKIV